MARPKKEEVSESVGATLPTTAELHAQILELQAQLSEKKTVAEVLPQEEVKAPVEDKMPVPASFTDAVNTILNNKFTVEIEYSSNTPNFGFSIIVPKEYSNAGKPHWDMYKEDRRTKMISNAEGVEGVKIWVQKVYDNFDMETKSKIAADRSHV